MFILLIILFCLGLFLEANLMTAKCQTKSHVAKVQTEELWKRLFCMLQRKRLQEQK
ncbi:hypothetical protein SEVIR_2G271266v4 [Setaria viridis]|uniref:Uncharacterized protein n=1 Tax=Setaria viridis TaxID=4556 RepID=A0A4U6VVF3_SETVI|nr:hypothetical protein SEVIR_2G271266v2 [Setaria viridis]